MPSKKRVRKPDTSPYVHQSKKKPVNLTLDCRIPWTEKQLEFFRLAQDKNTKIIYALGPAGTSKTLVAVYQAILALKDKKVSDIVYLRSVVESSTQKMGFLPGTLDDKLDPYLEPLLDKVDEILDKDNKKLLLDNELVAGKPINYLRGCQFSGKFVILDEAQNLDKKEFTTFLTRIGEFSKVMICGDEMQSDINGRSALPRMAELFDNDESRENGIHVFRFGTEDIVRSTILKFIVEKLEKYEE